MAAHKILIVEDEQPIREMIAFHLNVQPTATVVGCRQLAGPLDN